LDFDEDLGGDGSDFERIDTDGDIGLEINKSRDRVNISSILKKRSISGGPNKKQRGQGLMKYLDMRHILGFLNQSEWVNSLNIGNIM
jgi:hypothetical protein